MKKIIIALAAAWMLVPVLGHAKKLSDTAWHKKFDNCEMVDRRGPNHDGDEFCMSKAQIDAFNREALMHYAPGYKNCLREAEDAKRLGGWYGKPSGEECLAWANDLQAKGRDMIDKGLRELMEAK